MNNNPDNNLKLTRKKNLKHKVEDICNNLKHKVEPGHNEKKKKMRWCVFSSP